MDCLVPNAFFVLIFIQRNNVPLHHLRQIPVRFQTGSKRNETKTEILISTGRYFFRKNRPHFFYRAAVPERIAFFHAAVKFRIHITVRVELGTDARTSCRVAPQKKNVTVFKICYERAIIRFVPIVVHAEVRTAVDIIRIEGIRFPVGVRCMLGHSAVINETDLFIIP